jgi:hypothetical protein
LSHIASIFEDFETYKPIESKVKVKKEATARNIYNGEGGLHIWRGPEKASKQHEREYKKTDLDNTI